jgi:methylmalonyl-CoA mutase N-terminal domain/subunit
MLACIEKGSIQQAMLQQAYETEKMIKSGKIMRVGENVFVNKAEKEPDLILQKFNSEGLRRQVERLRRVKAERDGKKVKEALAEVQKTASTGKNLLPSLITAVKAYATNAEMVGAMKEVFGEYRETGII